MKQRQTIILLSAILGVLALAAIVRATPLPDASDRIASFPTEGPGYSSREAPLSEAEEKTLGAAKGYKRIYAWKGQSYALTILDATQNRQAAHDPRYCFRGAGWTIREEEQIPFAGGTARRVTMIQDNKKSEALLYYSTGVEAFDQPVKYWLRTAQRRWLRKFGGPEPVLVMVQPISESGSLDPAIRGLLPLLPLP